MADQEVVTRSQRTPKRHRLCKWLFGGLVVGLIGLIGLVGFGAFQAKDAVDNTYKSADIKKARDVQALLNDGQPISILLMGTDTGELGRNYKGRTDTLMVVTIDPKENQTTLMSVPRDTLVAVPGFESKFPQKINSAYEDAEAAGSIATIQNWLNIPIDFYALVNMGGLEKVVDQIGGIQVKSPMTFDFNPDTAHEDPGNLYHFEKGSSTFTHEGKNGKKKTYTKMDGAAALAFSRMRYADPEGDYGRQSRQRLVMLAILDQVKQHPEKLLSPDFMQTLSKSAQTDLSFGDLTTIGQKYHGALQNIESDNVQGFGYNLSSGSTEVVYRGEQQRVTDLLRENLGLEPSETGNLYAGEVNDAEIRAVGAPTLEESIALSKGGAADKPNMAKAQVPTT